MRKTRHVLGGVMAASALVAVTGCSDGSSPGPAANETQRVTMSLQNENTDGGALVLDPRTATLHVGYGILIGVNITGPDGQPVDGATPSWTSTNPAVVRVDVLPDSGFANDGWRASVAGVSEGTARVIAAYNGAADTAFITVAPARVDTTDGGGGGGSYEIPEKFQVGFYISTDIDSTLLAQWAREPVPNATVRLYRLPPSVNDSIPSGVPPVTEPTLFATVVSDTAGFVLIHQVPMGPFRVEVDPPAGSAWEPKVLTFSTPYLSSVRYEIRLPKD